MVSLGSVQNKVSCAFEISVLPAPSEKRSFQPYKVVATDRLREEAIKHDIHNAHPSEKLDGTCVLITPFQGKPWLWARHDRKPNKKAEKKFRAFQNLQQKQPKGDNPVEYVWNVETDFREIPDHWVPALGVEVVDGVPQPDRNGHIPGWVPVDPENRQQCWHLTAVRLNLGLALVLREDGEGDLEIVAVPLSELEGHTAELIGTNVNGNAYNLGCKQFPLHVLVVHGSIGIRDPPALDITAISDWFASSPGGMVEGIVWHCPDTTLFKLHRHHTSSPWPVKNPLFCQRPVTLRVDLLKYSITEPANGKQPQKDLFWLLGNIGEIKCDSVSAIHELFNET